MYAYGCVGDWVDGNRAYVRVGPHFRLLLTISVAS